MRDILRPMLASLADAPLDDPRWVYEPKYDGIRAIAEVDPRSARASAGPQTRDLSAGLSAEARRAKAEAPKGERRRRPLAERSRARLWSRLGNEKTGQFPEIAAALTGWARRLKAPVILDGEIVALDAHGEPTGFQQLQGRIHLAHAVAGRSSSNAAYIVFDLLQDGAEDLRARPLTERRAALERLFRRTGTPLLRVSEQVAGDGRTLYERALERGWEGLIAKAASSPYKSGKRTPDWRKLKIVQEQEFVVGGWTEPRHSREYFGALLLGYYATQPPPETPHDHTARGTQHKHAAPGTQHPAPGTEHQAPEVLVYAGHTGTGFDEKELARVMRLLTPLETRECPFPARPKTNERPHWVRPALVAQIKFSEWTADARLRHPVYLGLRDDKNPRDVHREPVTRRHGRVPAAPHQGMGSRIPPAPTRAGGGADTRVGTDNQLIERLRELEDARRGGAVALPGDATLEVSNLHKIFWPEQKLTKGDLLRYYVEVAACILPVLEARPLVMKRFPNGMGGKPFYQQRAPADVPAGVTIGRISGDQTPSRLIGGSLTTLLYAAQLAAISQDPWFSRADTPSDADHVALDLDPADGVDFARVLDVARWIHDELEWLGTPAFPKTSGADGLHIYIPLPPRTPYDAGLLFCQIVATVVAQKHPREATVERAVRARGRRVYIDYLQNVRGKTLASAYSARASAYAGASAPVSWEEVHDGFDREDFTIRTLPARIREIGDPWARLRASKGADLSRAARYMEAAGRRG